MGVRRRERGEEGVAVWVGGRGLWGRMPVGWGQSHQARSLRGQWPRVWYLAHVRFTGSTRGWRCEGPGATVGVCGGRRSLQGCMLPRAEDWRALRFLQTESNNQNQTKTKNLLRSLHTVCLRKKGFLFFTFREIQFLFFCCVHKGINPIFPWLTFGLPLTKWFR